ncbi:hypothetical protein DID88_007778 [Monilinia fructigena]|uniref:2EXR domain-containing protein n=1 Tax=Monilinia fructigena TaxID=38457 RepID=A0A395J4C3_9HELO|nr:hypothetical protein DID88_007778 [Monilinia fructigena]
MSQNQHQAAHQRLTQVGVNPDDTFPFVNLTLELQRKIWKHAAVSQPRVIQLKICEAINTYNLRASDIQYQIPEENLPEVLLKTCFESQDIVKKNYKYTKFLGSPLCYDPDIDVLWVRGMLVFLVDQELDPGTNGGYAGALFEQKEHPLGRPYLFRSVALEFAGIKKSHKDYVTSTRD